MRIARRLLGAHIGDEVSWCFNRGILGGDGLRIDTGIAQLTSAMAAYQAANASFNPLTDRMA